MVYCGKASLGCSLCRKRRIKCDRRQPECTQCARLSKKCPGYRDQLSLMFRDETVKVEKRVRASWGQDDQASASSSSPSSSSSSDPSKTTSAKSTRSKSAVSTTKFEPASIPTPPASVTSTSPVSIKSSHAMSRSPPPTPIIPATTQRGALVYDTLCHRLDTTPTDLGVSFYVHHYVLNYPDEARRAEDLSDQDWFRHPSSQATMAALGLAALGNLNHDKRLQHLCRAKYGEALARTNEALRDPLKNLSAAIRTTVMLALFQCVHSTHESHESVRVHLLGCMALLRSAIPIRSAPAMGLRGVLQLCYSLLIPCISSGIGLEEEFFDSIRGSMSSGFLPPDEQPGAHLIFVIARFAQLNATIRATAYSDRRGPVTDVMRQLLEIDAAMDGWETSQRGKWRYQVHRDPSLPPKAVFRNRYQRYSDVWTSRLWNHFRWARLLTNQTMLEFVERYPTSAAGVVSLGQQDRIQDTIQRLAVDILTSVPTHYKHPWLTREQLDKIQTHGGAGAGAVGIPHLLFHLQVAACAPGVPYDVWRWALHIMDTAWAELGMLHAKSLAEVLRKHRAKLDSLDAETILKIEGGDCEGGYVRSPPDALRPGI